MPESVAVGPIPGALAGEVADHHRRTERLLEHLDDLCGSAVATVTRPDTALLVARLTDFIRAGDQRLQPLVARLQITNPEED
jgi:hypothetical protein